MAAGGRTIKISGSQCSSKAPTIARQIKHGEEKKDKDWKVTSLSFVASLRACAKKKDLHQGSRIHADIRNSGLLEKNTNLGNMLVGMYAKCGALDRAQQVVDELPVRNVVSWSSLIAGFVQHGHGKEALGCFHRMRSEGLCPDAITYTSILKACAITKEGDLGQKFHDEIITQGLLKQDVVLGNALVDMYAKCGVLKKAQKVLDGLPVRNVVSWSALIAGYAHHGHGKEALGCFHRMRSEGLSPDAITYASILKACGITQDAELGKNIHDEIISQGLLKKDAVLGNAVVDMYAKCGVLMKAQNVFDELPIRNVISWNTLIGGYVQHGHGKEALGCFHRMRSEGLSPDAITYACILKACGIIQEANMGKRFHDEIASQGLLKGVIFLGNALVDMYAKCGLLMKAQKVLDELPIRNVVSWSALIAGYAQRGQGQEALGCFQRMRNEGLSPDAITFACILKACGITQNIDMGKKIHDEIICEGLMEKDVVLGNALIDMYAKCGAIMKAQKVLDEVAVRDVVSWSALIAGYAQRGQGHEALGCFQRMRSEGLSPNAVTYACILKACGITHDVDMGNRIYDEIASQGLLKKEVMLGNALIDMYAKCGVLIKAQKVLDELPVRNVASWNAVIAGYVQHGHYKEALGCFHRMQSEGLSPDAITYACILRACGIMQESDMGTKLHDEIVSQELLKKDVVLGNALVDMYAKCDVLMEAKKVFDGLPVRNIISWNSLIAGYVQHGHGKEALGCFYRMRSEGLSPDAITYACILKACAIMQEADMGKKIHEEIVSQGPLKNVLVLGNVLVDMYAKCGVLMKAQKVLDELPIRDVISWNTLIAGYVQHGHGEEALGCFHRMQSEGLSPDAITSACILKACGIMQETDMGKKVHDEIASQGLFNKDVVLGNALVNMYAKCGLLMKAQKVFDELPIRDVVSWSALIAGYVQQGQGQEALACFQQMRSDGLSADAITYACILKACSITQDVDMGIDIHDEIVSLGMLKTDVLLGNALVDMYAKCGVLTKAQKVVDELLVRNVVSWNALITGYAQQGQGQEALGCFQRMRKEGFSPNVVSWNALIGGYAQQGLAEEALDCFQWMQQEGTLPDAITFISVLNACSHSGLVDEGQMYFDNMRVKYGITPDKEHYSCMVDLFGRSRLFDRAMKVIKMMPSTDYSAVWSALLGACRKWGNVKLGRLAFDGVVQLDGCNAAAYVTMSSIYAAAGMQDEARNIERMRMKNAVAKCSARHSF